MPSSASWLLHAAFDRYAGIAFGIRGLLVLLAAALLALPFDRRLILGLNPWIKPLKFDVSVIIFLATVGVLLALLPQGADGPGRWPAIIGWGTGIALLLENAIISLQSVRGVRSHMNYTSAFNSAAFGLMGLLIAFVTLLMVVLLVLYLLRGASLPAPLLTGILLGLVVLLAGSAEGVLMVGRFQAHTVGAADGGPGLPLLNWSTQHGDLRVAHFFALHALQLFMIAGWALSRAGLSPAAGVLAMIAFALTYSAGVAWLFVQAMAGRSLLPT